MSNEIRSCHQSHHSPIWNNSYNHSSSNGYLHEPGSSAEVNTSSSRQRISHTLRNTNVYKTNNNKTITKTTTTSYWRHVLFEKLIFVEVFKTFLSFQGKRRSSIGFLIHFIYMYSLSTRFYFHTSRHKNNEIIEDSTKFTTSYHCTVFWATRNRSRSSKTTFLTSIFRGPQIFQKSISQHKSLCARRVTLSQYYTE